MTTEFNQLNLLPELVQAVTERGYAAPMPIQSAVIPVMLAGSDVIGQAQTGTGKTAAFALPILQNLEPARGTPQALIVVPTRELALQVSEAFKAYGQFSKARVLAIYGGQSYDRQISQLRRGVEIVVGTPGRLLDLIRKELLDIRQVRTVVLDEADEMLSMGFIEDVEALLAETPAERQTALFSATLPPEIRALAERYMRDPQSITIQSEKLTVDAIEQRYYLVNTGDKTAALTRLFEVEDISSALIFVRTRSGTSELANELTVRGFPAEALNGDLNQEARERTLSRFRQKGIQVLVATDVAARGLDIEDISHVFNFDLPDDPEIYVHRIGRTGRAGKTGIAITLVTPAERRRLSQIEGFTRQKLAKTPVPSEEEIKAHREGRLINQMTIWLRRGRYLREREMVNDLIEQGHDPAEIAAAALKIARADEKQRPIAPVSEVHEFYGRSRPITASRARGERSDRPERASRAERGPRATMYANEPGMVRLSLNIGRQHGIRVNDVVGAIAGDAKIPGSAIGKIQIQDRFTLVDVPQEFAGQVLAKNGQVHIRRQPVQLQVAG